MDTVTRTEAMADTVPHSVVMATRVTGTPATKRATVLDL